MNTQPACYVIDGYPPAVYRHASITRTADGFHLIAVPGIDRPKWFHPSNVYPTRQAATVKQLKRRLAERWPAAHPANQ
jgi:hypothetical protein